MQKTSRKVEETSAKKVETVEAKKEEQSSKKEQEQRIIENANYLTNILEIKFGKAFVFSQKFPEVSKEELLELYFNQWKWWPHGLFEMLIKSLLILKIDLNERRSPSKQGLTQDIEATG